MKIVQISESDFTVKGHGVHTAYIETVNGLRKSGATVLTNSKESADIRHIHTVGLYSLRQLLFLKGKKVVSAHIVPESLVGSLVGAQYWLPVARVYLRWFYNRADLVLAVSDTTKQWLQDMGVKKPIEVVYNMVDTNRYTTTTADKIAARKKLGFSDDEWVVVGNGQVQPRKRVDTFVRLAKELPKMKFVWVGGIPFKNVAANYQQMKRVMEKAPTNTLFTGVVDLDDVKTYFQAADVFVMTSDQETFGLAIVEAAASGLPVVLRDIHDYDKTFRANALMCKEDEFASTLALLKTDTGLYEKMRKESLKLAHRYDSLTISRQLIGLYEGLLKK